MKIATLAFVFAVGLFGAGAAMASDLLVLYGDTNCGQSYAIIPVAAGSAVNCQSIPGADNYVYSMRASGDSTCVTFNGQVVVQLCKAYNGQP